MDMYLLVIRVILGQEEEVMQKRFPPTGSVPREKKKLSMQICVF